MKTCRLYYDETPTCIVPKLCEYKASYGMAIYIQNPDLIFVLIEQGTAKLPEYKCKKA